MKATVKKKTYNLREVIEKVRRLFNAKTDTEAIQRALQKAVEIARSRSRRIGSSRGAGSGRCTVEYLLRRVDRGFRSELPCSLTTGTTSCSSAASWIFHCGFGNVAAECWDA